MLSELLSIMVEFSISLEFGILSQFAEAVQCKLGINYSLLRQEAGILANQVYIKDEDKFC